MSFSPSAHPRLWLLFVPGPSVDKPEGWHDIKEGDLLGACEATRTVHQCICSGGQVHCMKHEHKEVTCFKFLMVIFLHFPSVPLNIRESWSHLVCVKQLV